MGKSTKYGKLQLIFFKPAERVLNINSDIYSGEDEMSKKGKGKEPYNDNTGGPKPKQAMLYNGFFWDCDKCGQENFERAIVPEVDTDILEAVKELHNIDNKTSHIMFYSPDTVKCKSCHECYKAQVNSF